MAKLPLETNAGPLNPSVFQHNILVEFETEFCEKFKSLVTFINIDFWIEFCIEFCVKFYLEIDILVIWLLHQNLCQIRPQCRVETWKKWLIFIVDTCVDFYLYLLCFKGLRVEFNVFSPVLVLWTKKIMEGACVLGKGNDDSWEEQAIFF